MNINNLKIGQAKELSNMVSDKRTLNRMVDKKVIVRTCSAGVFFGTLAEKAGKEVIIEDARRLYRWWAARSISLSAVAVHGIKRDKSKICEAVPEIWLEAVEILPCSNVAIESIEGAEHVKAE